MEIVKVETGVQLEQVKALLEQYWTSFGFTPCFQNFDDEMKKLPGAYAPPSGQLVLAMVDGKAAGCFAYRRFDEVRCEAKRLFVSPEFREQGIGVALLEWMISEARAVGYREMICDTMPVMRSAVAMYKRAGFFEAPPYADDPTPGAVFLRLVL